jgi:hypothetical protein
MIISDQENMGENSILFNMKYSLKLIFFVFIFSSLIFFLLVSNSCSRLSVTENNRFLELLSLLPANAKESGGFALIDYELIRKANNISLDISDSKQINRDSFLNILLSKLEDNTFIRIEALSFSSFYTGWGRYVFDSPIKFENIGYSLIDVDAEINNIGIRPDLGLSPDNKFNFVPDLMVAGIGRFNPQATKSALENKDVWPLWVKEKYAAEDYHNITIYSWGGIEKHLKDKLSPPHLSPTGIAAPIAISDKYLFVSDSVENVKAMIDSSKNKISSLFDVEEYKLLAQGLYNLGAQYAAIIGDEALANGYWVNYKFYPGPRLKKFLTFGSGFGTDEKGEYIALVLVHENSENAKENVSLLKQRILTPFAAWDGITEGFNDIIYATDVHTEGKVLLAKLYTKDKTLWRIWFQEQYPLLLHEQ